MKITASTREEFDRLEAVAKKLGYKEDSNIMVRNFVHVEITETTATEQICYDKDWKINSISFKPGTNDMGMNGLETSVCFDFEGETITIKNFSWEGKYPTIKIYH